MRLAAGMVATLVALAACSERSHDKVAGESAAASNGSDVSHAYVRALLGKGGDGSWPTAAIASLLAVAGQPADARPAYPNLRWQQSGLTISWQTTVLPKQQSCAAVLPALDKRFTELGFGRWPDRKDGKQGFISAAQGLRRIIDVECLEASNDSKPGCTGGSCARPLSVRFHINYHFRRAGFHTYAEALAPFPAVRDAFDATLVPEFLRQHLATTRLESIFCEGFTGKGCQHDLRFEVMPEGDAKEWILATIELGKRHGFACDQTWRDPSKDDIASTQECSGKNLWYHLEDGRVRLRLATIIGAEARGNPVECSESYKTGPGSGPDAPADPAVDTLFDVPVKSSAVAHIDKLATCYASHQRELGRTAELAAWRRLGDYVQRSAVDKTTGQEATIGFQRSHTGPAGGFFLRVTRQVDADLALLLYLRQAADHPNAGGHLELTSKSSALPFKLNILVASADAAATFADEQAFANAVTAAIDSAHKRKLTGIRRRQECTVLANRGQECEWVATTAAEQKEQRERLESDKARLGEMVASDAGRLLELARSIYPWAKPECALSASD